MTSTLPGEIVRSRHISLTTFRKTGLAVATPVGFLADGDRLVVLTPRDSGKVKRLRNDTSVTVAPCDGAGRIADGAPTVTGVARLLDPTGTARARRLMTRRYPVAGLVFLWDRLRGRGDRLVGIEVSL